MKTVRFLSDESDRRPGGRAFEKGRAYSGMSDASAHFWVVREKAVYDQGATDAIDITPQPAVPAIKIDLEQRIERFEQDMSAAAEKADGDAVDSPANVAGADGGDSGERPVNERPARRARAPRGGGSGRRRGRGQ